MKCKKLKRLACLLLALGMLAAEAVTIGAAELPEVQSVSQVETADSGETGEDGLVIGIVQVPMTREAGGVIRNLVRLHKGPDSTSLILETMSLGETVYVDMDSSAVIPSGQWLYVKRDKTGTWGWVLRDYIAIH